MIVWNKIKERHLMGSSKFGPIWIRFNREGFATGVYTNFRTLEKWIPDEETLEEDVKAYAELLVEQWAFALKIEELNGNV
jgi:hypothetical protein